MAKRSLCYNCFSIPYNSLPFNVFIYLCCLYFSFRHIISFYFMSLIVYFKFILFILLFDYTFSSLLYFPNCSLVHIRFLCLFMCLFLQLFFIRQTSPLLWISFKLTKNGRRITTTTATTRKWDKSQNYRYWFSCGSCLIIHTNVFFRLSAGRWFLDKPMHMSLY